MKKRYGASEDKLLKPPPPRKAVVYLEGDFSGIESSVTDKVYVMKQEGLQFVPSTLVIQKGSSVSFPNLDPVYHNVFSYTKDKRFDLGRYEQGQEAPAVKFDKAGEVKLYCEIHSHMRASIYVVDSPFYTLTSVTGEYTLENVPAGDYTLKAFVSSRKKFEMKVTVPEEGTVTFDFKK